MNVVLTPEEIEFNRSLDPPALLRKLGFDDKAIADDGRHIRLYCPIHKDEVRRSLIIDRSENRYSCQYKSCPAHGGGLLIELVAQYLGVDVPEAIAHLGQEEQPERQLNAAADRAVVRGDMTEAVRLLEEAVRLTPRDEITRCKLAAAYLETGQRDKGFREYLVAAEDFAVKNQTEKTLSIYNVLVMLSPQDMRVRRQMALLFSRLGRHADGAEHLKWVIDYLIARGELEEAMKVTIQMLELAPGQPEIHLLVARLLSQSRRISQAVSEAQIAAELALEKKDRRLADEAVTFGLMYHPQHERLRQLEARLNETPAAPEGPPSAEDNRESEFNEWLESLHEEVAAPKKVQLPPLSAHEVAEKRQREWQDFCQKTLGELDVAKLNSMGQHLRMMFDDAEASFRAGTLSQWEMEVLKEFYTTFCTAYDQVRRDRVRQSGVS
jgi:tetratricopeptide (TPR) repeat protein